jgi:hypothetical protein
MDIDKKLTSKETQLLIFMEIQFTPKLNGMTNMNGMHGPMPTPMMLFTEMLMLIHQLKHILQVTTVTTHSPPMIQMSHGVMLMPTIRTKELPVIHMPDNL